MYMIKYLKQKQYKNALWYTGTLIVAAVTGILIFPHSITHIFFGYRGKQVTTNLLNISYAFKRIVYNVELVNSDILNCCGIALIILMMIICVCWIFANKKTIKKPKNTGIIYVAIPMIVYLIVAMVASPYIDIRYLMPITPLLICTLIYIIKDMLEDIINPKKVLYITLTLSIIFAILVIPKISNNVYTYKGFGKILNYVEENLSDKPLIYVYEDTTAQYNKIMGCYYLLTQIDQSYIIPNDKFDVQEMKTALSTQNTSNGFNLMLEQSDQERVINQIKKDGTFTNAEYLFRIGKFVMYTIK